MNAVLDAYRASVPPHLDSGDLTDPARLLHDLAAATPPLAGRSLLCQVARPATDQLLVAHTDVWSSGGPPGDECDAQEEVRAAMRRIGHRDFDWDDDVRLTSAVVIVVLREGRAVPRAGDFAVTSALRYANNAFQALTGDLLVVTTHGWVTVPDRVAGLAPVALVALVDDVASSFLGCQHDG